MAELSAETYAAWVEQLRAEWEARGRKPPYSLPGYFKTFTEFREAQKQWLKNEKPPA